MKKFLAIILALTMLFSITACGEKGNNYKDLVNDAMEAIENGDESKLAKMYSSLVVEDYAEEMAEMMLEEYEYSFTDEYEVKSWKAVDFYESDAEELEALIEDFEVSFSDIEMAIEAGLYDKEDIIEMGFNINLDLSTIKGHVEAEIEIVVEDGDGVEYTSEIYFDLLKEGDTWKVASIEFGYIE